MALKINDSDNDGIHEINITPFVDVVLVLLVIFMVTTPIMVKESLKVNLPKTLTSEPPTKIKSIGIAVTKEGQFLLEGSLMSEESFILKLNEIAKSDKKTQFLISADAESKHKDVVKVIDLLKKNDLNSFALQVERIK